MFAAGGAIFDSCCCEQVVRSQASRPGDEPIPYARPPGIFQTEHIFSLHAGGESERTCRNRLEGYERHDTADLTEYPSGDADNQLPAAITEARERGEISSMDVTVPPPSPDSELEGDPGRDAAATGSEKARLQGLVKAFVQRAVKGSECEILDTMTAAKRPGMFVVDRRLRELCVRASEQEASPATDLIFPIELVNVWQGLAAVRVLPPEIAAGLPSDLVPRLLAITVEEQRVFFAESSAEEADDFASCMRVMREYRREQKMTCA